MTVQPPENQEYDLDTRHERESKCERLRTLCDEALISLAARFGVIRFESGVGERVRGFHRSSK